MPPFPAMQRVRAYRAAPVGMRARPAQMKSLIQQRRSGFGVGQFLERVEHLQARTPEIFVVAGHDRQIVAARRRGNIAVPSPFGSSRRGAGRSSIGTGHCFQTASQLGFPFRRRRIKTSSSASKVASNWSLGAAGASATGMLTRRLASSVTIMVGSSQRNGKM